MILFELVPFLVVPLIVINMVGTRSIVGTCFAMESVGVGLHDAVIPRSFNAILIAAEFPNALNKQLPNT